jgi:hypothetical protein
MLKRALNSILPPEAMFREVIKYFSQLPVFTTFMGTNNNIHASLSGHTMIDGGNCSHDSATTTSLVYPAGTRVCYSTSMTAGKIKFLVLALGCLPPSTLPAIDNFCNENGKSLEWLCQHVNRSSPVFGHRLKVLYSRDPSHVNRIRATTCNALPCKHVVIRVDGSEILIPVCL